MKEMILRLTKTKSRIRSSSHESKHANKARAEWMKSTKYYNYDKKGHIAKFCKKPKKKNDKNDTSERPEERHENYSQELDHTVIAYMKTSGEGA